MNWVEYRAAQTGKTEEEIRQEMRDRSRLADKSKSGFASMEKKKLREVGSKGGKSSAKKNSQSNSQG